MAGEGYVVRSVDCFTGRVMYQGKKEVISYEKDAIRMKDTYTLSGAKAVKSAYERKYPDYFFSIEKLSCCYYKNGMAGDKDEDKQKDRMLKSIEEAMRRLDELWDGNDFDLGDKMRINVVRGTLNEIKEELLSEWWGDVHKMLTVPDTNAQCAVPMIVAI